jgi:hypothetical protein
VDKILHCTISFILVYLINKRIPRSIAIAITIGLGILKELLDLYTYGLFSFTDIIFNLIGIGIYALFNFIRTYRARKLQQHS